MENKRTALISVYNKTGIVNFAKELTKLGFNIISTGGTASKLRDAGITVSLISDITGFPEILSGRVKTLHPLIFGGILADTNNKNHISELKKQNISPINLTVVNLYPFEEILKQGKELEEVIENIDIGGVSLLRASAKNITHCVPVVDPEDYQRVIQELKNNNCIKMSTRVELAKKVFLRTLKYEYAIYNFFNSLSVSETNGEKLKLIHERQTSSTPSSKLLILKPLIIPRYGENPHQQAVFYELNQEDNHSFSKIFKLLQGKPLSYNNILDSDAAAMAVVKFQEPTAVIVKHTNPCGIASSDTLLEAYIKAYETDPVSAFGSIVAFNRRVDKDVADRITKTFVEVILAPDFSQDSLNILSSKKDLRVICFNKTYLTNLYGKFSYRSALGGILAQCYREPSLTKSSEIKLKYVTKRKPTAEEEKSLCFAWHVAESVKSNAIVLAKNTRTVGIGAGQMSRIDACRFAITKASGKTIGAVLASDGFIPFPDVVNEAAQAKITAIIQPGGSVNDPEVIATSDKNGIAMVFTGKRCFLH